MKYVVLNMEKLEVDFSDGMPHDFEHELVNAGCAGHVPLEQYGNVMVVHDCDVALLGVPENVVVFQTDSDEDWQVWLDANTVQEAGE